jgi:hypothetical protein
MAVVIISCAICSVFGGSLGFLLGAICTMASDKNQQDGDSRCRYCQRPANSPSFSDAA